jgi:hypothetical protein
MTRKSGAADIAALQKRERLVERSWCRTTSLRSIPFVCERARLRLTLIGGLLFIKVVYGLRAYVTYMEAGIPDLSKGYIG